MKALIPITCIFIGFIAGKQHNPAQAYETPPELIYSVRQAISAAYWNGKQSKGDDIGLVRLTVNDVERLTN